MPNSWFQFKQFKVNQDKTAMKVGTDGVLLGAWADVENSNQILDVGTGTGLIALMLAQRAPQATVLGIDVDSEAAMQASQNFADSPWNDRLSAQKSDFKNFHQSDDSKFDHIVSNPPYFRSSLKSPQVSRTLARHDTDLTYESLISSTLENLSEEGRFSVVLPYVEGSIFIALAASKGLFCSRKVNVYPTPTSAIKRLLLEFRREKQAKPTESDLIIEVEGRHIYSPEYVSLTREFYLFM